ncbi:hypothetical protein Pogu_2064 [Pyrobaculum oguniense TE7]|uniref:Uncharacterized protein n=1 Tax=Pyrobaculum oguniense (strain DSM 13380 / JCM 10595 / TE7) TaxID=698757 RepID=H6QB94_PYROT|nr:hypothetical protein Pogu_2064 [Pyrobaculum oguniense TE7]
MLLAAGFVPTLLTLKALKSRALRRGVWHRLDPAARALVDASILYLRRGGRIKSQALAQALKTVAEKILALTTPLRLLAKAIGMAIARAKGVEIDEEKAVALGLQWINTPRRYKLKLVEP